MSGPSPNCLMLYAAWMSATLACRKPSTIDHVLHGGYGKGDQSNLDMIQKRGFWIGAPKIT